MTQHAARNPRRSGSLLVITLWLITILSVFAVAIARHLSLEIRLTKRRLAREQAIAMAHSGVYLAMQRLSRDAAAPEADGQSYDWLGDDWAVMSATGTPDPSAWVIPFGLQDSTRFQGTVTIHITDEERKLNVNTVAEPVLSKLLELVGAPADLARPILDDIDPDEEPPSETPAYAPKNAPMAAIEELLEVHGTAPVFSKLGRVLTASAGATVPPTVNINTAERDVLLALGGDPGVVEALTASRPGIDGRLGTEDDCRATDMVQAAAELSACALGGDEVRVASLLGLPTATFTVHSSAFRIQVDAVVEPQQVQRHVEAIVQRTDDQLRLLSWRER